MLKHSFYKYILTLLGCLAIGGFSHAQMVVTLQVNQAPQLMSDAGIDQVICPWDSAMLGGNPAQTGGTGTFVYAWSPTAGVSDPAAANPMANPTATQAYALMVTDANNCSSTDTVVITVDTCVGISSEAWLAHVDIVPNPNSGDFKLQISSFETLGEVNLAIMNTMGQTVYRKELGTVSGNYETRISPSALSAGVYYLRLSSGASTITLKMIIQ